MTEPSLEYLFLVLVLKEDGPLFGRKAELSHDSKSIGVLQSSKDYQFVVNQNCGMLVPRLWLELSYLVAHFQLLPLIHDQIVFVNIFKELISCGSSEQVEGVFE